MSVVRNSSRPPLQRSRTPWYLKTSPTFPVIREVCASSGFQKENIAMSTEAELRAELERLKMENEALKTRPRAATSLKVSEKGGVSVYGLGRFPVTLYKEQWLKLLDLADDIRAFLRDNQAHLKTKGSS